MYSDSTIPTSPFTATSELLALPPDSTIASGEASPAPVRAMPESGGDWLIQNLVCGGKCSELSSKLDPALLLSKIQRACSSGEVEKSLPLSEWQDIVSKTRSSYRQRKSEPDTKETESLSSLTFRTLHSSNTSTNSNPAGLTKCEQSLRKLGIISPSHYLSARGMELIFGFPQGWTECLQSQTLESRVKLKVESELDTSLLKQSCPDKLTLPSNECSTLPEPSESSIENNPEFALSGLGISFGKTLPYLPHKTVTRRSWKDNHAKKFINAFQQNKLIKALDKDIRYGGKQIGWCRLLCAPYKESLAAMPDEDLQAEGGMCSSVAEFVKRYFKGNSSLEVWVIRFEFIELEQLLPTQLVEDLGVYSDSGTKSNSNSALASLALSIHQTQLSDFGVYFDSGNKTNTYSFIASENNSIHQTLLTTLGVYANSKSKTGKYFIITSADKSIHQPLFTDIGVYSVIQEKTNSYFPFSLSIDSIQQASAEPRKSFGVYSNDSHLSNGNDSVPSTTKSVEPPSVAASVEHQTTPDVYQNSDNEVDINTAISLRNDSIHQDSRSSFGVYSNNHNQTNTNVPPNLLAESIHQTQYVQGGSGLVYSFWKGESIVNHYRYKVKVNGKWKVKSVYIPVGKLPKVREAITNKLGVTAIVTEVLGRQL